MGQPQISVRSSGEERKRRSSRGSIVAVLLCSLSVALVAAPTTLHAQENAGAGAEIALPGKGDVERMQTALNALGHDAGPVDGVAGQKTIAAMQAWQRAAGREATSAPDLATIAALEEAAATTSVADPVVAGTRPGAAAAPLPATAQSQAPSVPEVSSPARRGDGSWRPGTADQVTGLTPHGRRAEGETRSASEEPLPSLREAGLRPAGAVEGEAEPLPSVRQGSTRSSRLENRPRGVGTLPGSGRLGDAPSTPTGQPLPSQPRQQGPISPPRGALADAREALWAAVPAFPLPVWLTKARLAAALGALAILSFLCHRIARRRRVA
ncbi:MAG: peptidoglycan-binding domain-containing protein [Pseudomonadota bacterium]